MRTRRDLYCDAPRRADATAMPTRRAVRRRRAMWMRRATRTREISANLVRTKLALISRISHFLQRSVVRVSLKKELSAALAALAAARLLRLRGSALRASVSLCSEEPRRCTRRWPAKTSFCGGRGRAGRTDTPRSATGDARNQCQLGPDRVGINFADISLFATPRGQGSL